MWIFVIAYDPNSKFSWVLQKSHQPTTHLQSAVLFFVIYNLPVPTFDNSFNSNTFTSIELLHLYLNQYPLEYMYI